ncbi:MAG: hypothetical protein IBX63_02310 [Coriobacteriia bacterium]|nr:hypothetical protein [Coriobacteriia bacterium]
MSRPEGETGPPPTRMLTWIAWAGAALSLALPIVGWADRSRDGDMMVPLRMGVIGLVSGALAYWKLRRDIVLVAVVGNALTIAFVVLFALSLRRAGEGGW